MKCAKSFQGFLVRAFLSPFRVFVTQIEPDINQEKAQNNVTLHQFRIAQSGNGLASHQRLVKESLYQVKHLIRLLCGFHLAVSNK